MKRINVGGFLSGTTLFLIFIAITLSASAQKPPATIALKSTTFPFQPKEYFIQMVTSDLENETLGTVVHSLGELKEQRKVVLKGGLKRGLTDFINQGINQNTRLRPIVFKVKEMKVSETTQAGGLIKGSLAITISFAMLRDSNEVKLVEYKGGSRYTRSVNQEAVLETVMSKSLVNALHYFDKWMNREVLTNEKLAEKVRIKFSHTEKSLSNDTLFYASGRTLQWADFKSRPDNKSRFAAEIFPFFSFDESSTMVNGEIRVNLNLKVYLVRSFSWVKGFAQNSYTLNHEQRHFDMVRIAADRFKERIGQETLTVDNYQGIIAFEYLESLRDMNRMQLQYDKETGHGTDQVQQERWNRLIEDKLRSSI